MKRIATTSILIALIAVLAGCSSDPYAASRQRADQGQKELSSEVHK
ncbi:MAG TPA: hypothetical protein VFR06_05150 [Gallionellaceae bacterium]|nr:hypothetical protein [Gallionellaceae bacterium]